MTRSDQLRWPAGLARSGDSFLARTAAKEWSSGQLVTKVTQTGDGLVRGEREPGPEGYAEGQYQPLELNADQAPHGVPYRPLM